MTIPHCDREIEVELPDGSTLTAHCPNTGTMEGCLAPGATVQRWRGFEGAVAAATQGHDTVVSPTSHAYFDYDIGVTDLVEVYAFEPVPAELTAEQARLFGGFFGRMP